MDKQDVIKMLYELHSKMAALDDSGNDESVTACMTIVWEQIEKLEG